ncbi:MAG: DUF2085 domain-containing protein, partial [Terriglobia bacterium]
LLFGIPAFLALTSILAPLLEAGGWPRLAGRVYFLLSYFCHQIPSHSLWIFGAPTGVSSRSLFLYIAFVGAGVFMFRHRRLLSWHTTLLLLIPIWVDGLTQWAGWTEGSNFLRVATGTLGGIGIAGLVTRLWSGVAFSFEKESPSFLLLLNRAMIGVVIVTFLAAILPHGVATAQTKVTIREGTRLAVKTLETFSSGSAKKGEIVHFADEADDDVVRIWRSKAKS